MEVFGQSKCSSLDYGTSEFLKKNGRGVVRNFSDFNGIYNVQDIYILGVITEYRWQKIQEDMGFDPRCFTSASTFSGKIERVK